MMEYCYELLLDDDEGGTVIIQTDCEPREFKLAVQFVRQVDDYNVDILLDVIRAIDRKAERFMPDTIHDTLVF